MTVCLCLHDKKPNTLIRNKKKNILAIYTLNVTYKIKTYHCRTSGNNEEIACGGVWTSFYDETRIGWIGRADVVAFDLLSERAFASQPAVHAYFIPTFVSVSFYLL